MKRFELRLDDDLHARLTDLAEHERRSLHSLCVHLLDEGEQLAVATQGNYDNQMIEAREHRRRGLARLAADRGE